VDLLAPTPARVSFLKYIFGGIGPIKLGLCRAPFVPAVTDTIGTYQRIEANFPVYQRQAMSIASYNWDTPGNAVALGTIVTWTVTFNTMPNDIYGYFAVDSLNNLLWAQVDPFGPQQMAFVGQTYRVFPQVALGALSL
jgi:hypothetical protein